MNRSLQQKPASSSLPKSAKRRLPMFGPLGIQNPNEFLNEAKAYFNKHYSEPFTYKLKLDNFKPLYELGTGSFGHVVLVRYELLDKSYYAMKVLRKRYIFENKLVDYVLNEKRILQSLNWPFCIRLEYLTHDEDNLYYLLPFISGGDLFSLLEKKSKFDEKLSIFYAAQIVLALEYIHRCDIIYRDLKPENILIDHFGYLKIADFGFAKVSKSRTYTFCGTPEYIAPEVVMGIPYSKSVDWWATGVLIFELVNGQPPFHDKDDLSTYSKIVDINYTIPSGFSPQLKDLVTHLLQIDTTKRLGNMKDGVEGVKRHTWFKNIVWLDLLNRRVVPPYTPQNLGNFTTADFPHLKKIRKSFMIEYNTLDTDKLFEGF